MMPAVPNCRSCGAPLSLTLIDLGYSPLPHACIPTEQGSASEPYYPLNVRVCPSCWLCQTDQVLSSAEMAAGTGPSAPHRPAEIPAGGGRPALFCAGSELTKTADIAGAIRDIAARLQAEAVCTADVLHLADMISDVRLDRISHSQTFYPSLVALEPLLARHGLRVFSAEDVRLPDPWLRLHICAASAAWPEGSAVGRLRAEELAAGLNRPDGYAAFTGNCEAVRRGLMDFLTQAQDAGRSVAAYGTAAEGSTLLNYCAIGRDLVAYCVDPHAAGAQLVLPGSRIPVAGCERLLRDRPDYVLVLNGMTRDRLMAELPDIRALGTQFVTAMPTLSIIA